MKAILATMGLLSAMLLTAGAAPVEPSARTMEQRSVVSTNSHTFKLKEQAPNVVKTRRFAFSGIAVQLFKTRDTLQLINPFAPARYGFGRENVATWREPIVRRPMGLKFLSIEF